MPHSVIPDERLALIASHQSVQNTPNATWGAILPGVVVHVQPVPVHRGNLSVQTVANKHTHRVVHVSTQQWPWKWRRSWRTFQQRKTPAQRADIHRVQTLPRAPMIVFVICVAIATRLCLPPDGIRGLQLLLRPTTQLLSMPTRGCSEKWISNTSATCTRRAACSGDYRRTKGRALVILAELTPKSAQGRPETPNNPRAGVVGRTPTEAIPPCSQRQPSGCTHRQTSAKLVRTRECLTEISRSIMYILAMARRRRRRPQPPSRCHLFHIEFTPQCPGWPWRSGAR